MLSGSSAALVTSAMAAACSGVLARFSGQAEETTALVTMSDPAFMAPNEDASPESGSVLTPVHVTHTQFRIVPWSDIRV